jgi:hypothetical protein
MSGKLGVFTMVMGAVMSLAALCSAQVTTGTISGTVRDTSGAIVPGAKVTITNLGKGTSLVYRTDQKGYYYAPFLIPGVYGVTVEKNGFKTETRRGITLQVDQVARIDVTLSPGAVTQTISVTAAAPLVDSQTSTLGQVINQTTVEELPLNGRDWGHTR